MVFGGSAMFKILVVEDDKDLNITVCSFLNSSKTNLWKCYFVKRTFYND